MSSARCDQRLVRTPWVVGVLVLLLGGFAASVIGASVVAEHRQQEARHHFSAAAADVSARLLLTLEREHDLAVKTPAKDRATMATTPTNLDIGVRVAAGAAMSWKAARWQGR